MKKLFLALIFISTSAIAEPSFNGSIDDYAILHVESTEGKYIEIKQHEDGELYIKTNTSLDKASQLFFDNLIRNNILHGPCSVTQTNVNTKNNIGAIIDMQQ